VFSSFFKINDISVAAPLIGTFESYFQLEIYIYMTSVKRSH
jgi:hypothetical protein